MPNVVTPGNLGAEFQIGTATPNKITIRAATDTLPGLSSLAVAANYPSTSNTEAATPAYVTAALAALPGGAPAIAAQDEGTALGAAGSFSAINFTGAGVTATQSGATVTVSVAGAGAPTGTAGGDLAGTYPNPTVDGLRGVPISATAPTSGQQLVYNGSSWVPTTVATGNRLTQRRAAATNQTISDGAAVDVTLSSSAADNITVGAAFGTWSGNTFTFSEAAVCRVAPHVHVLAWGDGATNTAVFGQIVVTSGGTPTTYFTGAVASGNPITSATGIRLLANDSPILSFAAGDTIKFQVYANGISNTPNVSQIQNVAGPRAALEIEKIA